MKVSGVYEVIGRMEYRGHRRGARVEFVIDEAAEKRALARGDIRLIRRTTPSLQPGTFVLPPGWATQHEEVQ